MRHVDEAALALDLGDRLLERQPARDLLLDEEPDDLALARRLDLLGEDHLDAVLRALACASIAPEISLWSVMAIAPRPALARRRQQHLDRRRAVVAVVGVHVQVDVDQRPAARAGGGRRVASAGLRRASTPLVEASNSSATGLSGRGARPRARSRAAAPGRRSGARAARRARRPRAGSNSSPRSPSPSDLLVDRQARGDRDRAGAPARASSAGRGSAPADARRRRRRRRRAAPRTASSRRRRSARGRAGRRAAASSDGPSARAHDELPRRAGVDLAQRAEQQPQRRALLVLAEGDPHRLAGRRAARAGPAGAPGAMTS